MKKCTKCGIDKLDSDFAMKSGILRYSKCQDCMYSAIKSGIISTKSKVMDWRANYGAETHIADRKLRHEKIAFRKLRHEKRADRKPEYYKANKEKILAKQAEYYIANKANIAVKMREYAKTNAGKIKEYKRQYLIENAEQISQKRQDHYRRNNERIKERARDWRKANQDKCAELSRNRRARKRNAEGNHTAADVRAIFESQQGLCANCQTKLFKSGAKKYHVDHIMPLKLGGSNWPSNLQCLCPACNLSKGAKHPDEWAAENGRLI